MSRPHSTLQYVLVVGLLLCATGWATGAASEDLSFEYLPGSGAKILFRGVPVVRGTSLQLYAPGWKKGYYSSNGTPPVVSTQDGRTIVTHRAARGVDFTATETIRLVDAHHIQVTLEGMLTSSIPAKMEWSLGYVNAFAFYGGSYSAGDKAIPIEPMPASDTGNCTVIRDARSINFRGPLGDVRFTMTQGATGMSLLDGRLELGRHWSQQIPSFWIGCQGEDVPVGKPFKYVVTIVYEPGENVPIAAPVTAMPPLHAVNDAYVPQPKPIVIVPQPKKVKWNEGKLRFKNLDEMIRFRQVQLDNLERYTIHCGEKGIEITAADERGKFYARKTLDQIIQVDADGSYIPACDIDDWPTMKFRGVHIFPGKDALDFHRKLIERIFAGFKLNSVVLECEYGQWETNPKLWTDLSVPKDQLCEYVKIARDNFIEPIPLVQSLGHAEWMFKNGQNLDLAEDPRACWAYDATNPKTYDFIEKIYDEVIDVFHPKFFHVGHDEVDHRGQYPYREESKKHSVAELFAMDVKKLDGYFRPKGIRMMLWGDMMLDKSESSDGAANAQSAADAKLMRDVVPRDAVVCDWHYQPAKPQAYKSLRVFHDEGLQTLACTWYNPLNISSFAVAAQTFDSLGLLQTTWAGFNVDQRAMQNEFRQFTAYVLAAEYAWSGQTVSPDELPWRADEIFARAWNPVRQRRGKCAGFTVDLSQLSNLKVDANRPDPRLAGVRFDSGTSGVCLHGAMLNDVMPQSVSMKLDTSADEIAFLHATSCQTETGDNVGKYQIAHDDGTLEEVALRYGVNIRAMDDLATTTEAELVPFGKSSHGTAAGFRALTWHNPHPETRIASVTFSTTHPYASPVLLGITLLTRGEAK